MAEPSISTDHSGSLVWRRTGLWPGKIITELWRGSDGRLTLGVRAEEIVAADLLLYWAPGGSEATSVVPDRARFLGTVPGVAAIDPEISRSAGALLLYSLANHEWVATSRKFVLEKGE